MKKAVPNYSEHYEMIIALVTYLAVSNRRSRSTNKAIDNSTARGITKYLAFAADPDDIKYSSDEEEKMATAAFNAKVAEVELVLNTYKSLFRKTIKRYKEEFRYSLLLRYARRPYDQPNEDVSEPLANEELFSLLDFVSSKTKWEQDEKIQEVNNSNQKWAMIIAAFSAVVAAAASLYIAILH